MSLDVVGVSVCIWSQIRDTISSNFIWQRDSRSEKRAEAMSGTNRCSRRLHLSVTRIRRFSFARFFQTRREILVVITIYARRGEISFENSL